MDKKADFYEFMNEKAMDLQENYAQAKERKPLQVSGAFLAVKSGDLYHPLVHPYRIFSNKENGGIMLHFKNSKQEVFIKGIHALKDFLDATTPKVKNPIADDKILAAIRGTKFIPKTLDKRIVSISLHK